MEVVGEGDAEGLELRRESLVELVGGSFGVVDCGSVGVVEEVPGCYEAVAAVVAARLGLELTAWTGTAGSGRSLRAAGDEDLAPLARRMEFIHLIRGAISSRWERRGEERMRRMRRRMMKKKRRKPHQPGKQKVCKYVRLLDSQLRVEVIHAPCQFHELVNGESTSAHEFFVKGRGTLRGQSLDESVSLLQLQIFRRG